MKIQSLLAFAMLAALAANAAAQDAPAAAQAQLVKRAEALTQDQIRQTHDVKALARLGQIYSAQGDMQRFVWVLQRAIELTPNSGDLKLQLAMAYAKQGDKTHAYDTLVRMQTQGFGYDISKDPRFDPIHGTKVWDYIVANLGVNAKQFGEGKVAYSLPKGDYLFDALAWDPAARRLLVASARDGTVKGVDAHGKLVDFIAPDAGNGMWGADALAVDGAHGKLYVASSASAIYKGFSADNAGHAGVFEFDLRSGKFLRKTVFDSSDGAHRLTSLVAGKDGQVYGADNARKQVFKLEDGKLREILSNPRLGGIAALALSGDARTLYLADYVQGIFGFDLAKGEAFEPAFDASRLVLGGIVDMVWYDGTLAVVEDGMVPKRVMRLQLDADGRKITSAMPLDVAHPEFIALGAAAVGGDSLYYIANRQDRLYDSRGVLVDADKLAPTLVFRSNLRFAWGQAGVSGSAAPIKRGKPSAAKPDMQPGVPAPTPAPQPAETH